MTHIEQLDDDEKGKVLIQTPQKRSFSIIRPVRLQRKRTKGFRLTSPNGLPIVIVDRTTKWGNPFVVGKEHIYLPGRIIQDRRHAWSNYLGFAPQNEALVAAAQAELAGKNLACWCALPEDPYEKDLCHGDILLKLANGWPLIKIHNMEG